VLRMHSESIDSLNDSTLGKLVNKFEASRSTIDGDQEGERAGNGKSEILFLRTALDMRVMLAICRACCLCRSRQIFAFSLWFIRMLLLFRVCVDDVSQGCDKQASWAALWCTEASSMPERVGEKFLWLLSRINLSEPLASIWLPWRLFSELGRLLH
jgi:hypothetical protein